MMSMFGRVKQRIAQPGRSFSHDGLRRSIRLVVYPLALIIVAFDVEGWLGRVVVVVVAGRVGSGGCGAPIAAVFT